MVALLFYELWKQCQPPQIRRHTVQLFREFSLLNIFRDSGPPERLEYPQFSPLTVVVQGRSMGLRNPLESLVECGSFTLSRVPRERGEW
mmetsp:Transcript_1745/g.2891  ORF Transcript_1745/g.2891 Transcript_1745/m.2891 type:complete len:89 (+) Transcript_1745:2939-3205(+)